MRTLGAVLVAVLVLAPLAAWAARGVRRARWAGDVEQTGRNTLQAFVEGLIVLAVVIIGVVIVVALFD